MAEDQSVRRLFSEQPIYHATIDKQQPSTDYGRADDFLTSLAPARTNNRTVF
jgi:hypothetical protein